MVSKMKKLIYLTTIVTMLLLVGCGGGTAGDGAEPSPEKKKGEISEQALDAKIVLQINDATFSNKNFKMFLKAQYPDIADQKNAGHLLSRIFDLFVEHRVILYQAEAEQISLNENERDEYLQKLNMSTENISGKFINESIKVQKYLYFVAYDNIEVSEAEVRKYYQDHLDEFRKKEELEVYQILVKNREKAIELRGALLNSPGKFEEMARSESLSPEAKKNGLMGYFEKGMLPKEMEDVVFSLRINEISPIVESPYGFHIFKVKRKKRERLLYFENVKDDINDKLLSEKIRLARQELLDTLKKQLTITLIQQNLYFKYTDEKGEVKDEDKAQ